VSWAPALVKRMRGRRSRRRRDIYTYQGAGADRADGPDIVWERSGCSGRSLIPRAQLVAQLAGNFLDRGQGRGTVQATL
jgi:hypothetical protein